MSLIAAFSRTSTTPCAPFGPRTGIADLADQIEAANAAIVDRDLPHARALALRARDGAAGLVSHLAQMTASLEARRQRDEQSVLPLLRLGTPKCLDFASRRLTADQADIEDHLLRLRKLAAGCPCDLGQACARLEAGLRRLIRLEAETLLAILED